MLQPSRRQQQRRRRQSLNGVPPPNVFVDSVFRNFATPENASKSNNSNNHHNNSNNYNFQPLVVCGPSGVGKGTIVNQLLQRYSNPLAPSLFGFSVSHTTRPPRPGEVHGQHYYFTTIERMQQQMNDDQDFFVEYAQVHGNWYGTSKHAIAELQQQNKITILDIDQQGVMAVKKSNIPAKYIFIAPPSLQVLEERLRKRGTETEEDIARRLSNAADEIKYGQEPGNFDHVIINDDVDEAVQELVDVLSDWYPQLKTQS